MIHPAFLPRAAARSNTPGRWWSARWKLIATAVAMAAWRGVPASYGHDLDMAVREALAAEAHLIVDAAEALHWVDATRPTRTCVLGGARIALRARHAGDEQHDVYLTRVELSPEGALLRLCGVDNLTNTALADETALVGSGPRLAWRLERQGRAYRVEYADLRGASPSETADWRALARWQWRLTQLQQTGQLAGIARRSFRLDPASPRLELHWSETALDIRADDRTRVISTLDGPRIVEARRDAPGLIEEPRAIAHPGNLLTWGVDRARALPWFGSERVQWLKAIGFALLDRLERALAIGAKLDADLAEGSEPEAAEVDTGRVAPATPVAPSESGFPPAPLVGRFSPSLPGEGEWRSLAGDPFVKAHPGLPPPFATTFIRPDPRLETARVMVVIWDPRRVDLHFVAGTEEPQSATGEIGAGQIPRSPAVLSRLLGAFNGGFQSIHGAFGAQVDGKLLIPPRPYAATVTRFDDGAIGFGTWPLSTEVPAAIDSFRQNLTPLVGSSVLNPYRRQWWGGAPLGWLDVARTVRSALCQTEEGLVAYFYGSRVDHEALGNALLLAHCRYGLHLDMNAGHTGFEFYSVVPGAEPPLPAGELETRWKVEAPVPELPDLRYRSRRLFRNMQLMHFPRYIQRQARDFFYLTERTLLPGPSLSEAPATPLAESDWSPVAAGPRGFPRMLERAQIRPDLERPQTVVQLLELDLKWVSATMGSAGPAPSGSLLSVALPADGDSRRALWIGEHIAHVGAPPAGAHVIAREVAHGGHAAWGVSDGQILIYAEVVTGRDEVRDAALLDRVLSAAGASEQVITIAPDFIALAGHVDLAGQVVDLRARAAVGEAALHFQPHAWQALRPLFADTAIVDPETWQPYQP